MWEAAEREVETRHTAAVVLALNNNNNKNLYLQSNVIPVGWLARLKRQGEKSPYACASASQPPKEERQGDAADKWPRVFRMSLTISEL